MDAIGSTALRILEFILSLGVLIFLHELGHYLTSKIFKIEVEEFGFGFPPRLTRLFRIGETEFTLNWIPFGAFVRPKGENDPNVPGGLANAAPLKRLMVLFGGPLMNLITAVILFAVIYARVGVPDMSRVLIIDVTANTPAEVSGIQVGDILVSADGQSITTVDELHDITQANLGQEMTIILQRGDEQITVNAIPRAEYPSDQGPLGITVGVPYVTGTNDQTISMAVDMTFYQVKEILSLPVQLIKGTVSADEARFVGPKGMYDIYSQAREIDEENAGSTTPAATVNTLWLLANISIALGITNLLPLPALDGGRMLFVLPELILRKRVPAKYENAVHFIGFALLLILMVVITAQDIINPIVLP
jgi:regulator of sigma E protease